MGEKGDRRTFRRYTAKLRVSIQQVGRRSDSFAEVSRDISLGGLFVETTQRLPLGTVVKLEIDTHSGESPARLPAEVVRYEESLGAPGWVGGMGFRFVDARPRAIKRLLAFLEQLDGETMDVG